MAESSAKLWLQKNANQVAINRAQQAIQNTGQRLPCRVVAVNGSIVTVAFEVQDSPQTLPNITIPKEESPWVRSPTQIGDKGYTQTADAYLGGVSGLGGGVANMIRRGNLSALVFAPISNAESGPIDPNAAQVQGPNGAIIQTTEGTASSVITNTSGTTVTFGSNTVVVNNTETALTFGSTSLVLNASGITMTVGGQTITLGAGGFLINGQSYINHDHLYTPGTGTPIYTGPVNN